MGSTWTGRNRGLEGCVRSRSGGQNGVGRKSHHYHYQLKTSGPTEHHVWPKDDGAYAWCSFCVFRANVSLGIFRTNEQGEILLANQPEGSYQVEERSPGDDEHIIDIPLYAEMTIGMGIIEQAFYNDRLPGIHLIRGNVWTSANRCQIQTPYWGDERFLGIEEIYDTVRRNHRSLQTPRCLYLYRDWTGGAQLCDWQGIANHPLGWKWGASFVFINSKLPFLHLQNQFEWLCPSRSKM